MDQHDITALGGSPRHAASSAIGAALDDYQRWTVTTAKYPEMLAIPYLALGLGDEASGELLPKAKDITVTESLRRVRAELLPELGDVHWYLAQLLLKLDIRLSEAFTISGAPQPDFDATLDSAVECIAKRAGMIQGRIKKSIRDGADVREPVLQHAAHILRAADSVARQYGSNLLLVLGDNRRKLDDRLQRGAIKGEGDHR